MKLAEMTWPEVDELDRNILIIYPIGALEQHSHHLPFYTDSILCDAVAARIESSVARDVLVLPVQWLGASAHHLGMPGTLTAEIETHIRLICEPLRCLLRAGFKRVFIINGHGGNIDTFHLALRQLALEFPDRILSGASYWDLASVEIANLLKGDLKSVGHACEFETSLMMHVRPDLVRESKIKDGATSFTPVALRQVYMPLDMKRQTLQGGTGQATCATAEMGKMLMNEIVAKAIDVINAIRIKTPIG